MMNEQSLSMQNLSMQNLSMQILSIENVIGITVEMVNPSKELAMFLAEKLGTVAVMYKETDRGCFGKALSVAVHVRCVPDQQGIFNALEKLQTLVNHFNFVDQNG